MSFLHHRDGDPSAPAFPGCKLCKRHKARQPATLALLCLTGSVLWKAENEAKKKTRAPVVRDENYGKHRWDVLEPTAALPKRLSRTFEVEDAARVFCELAKAAHPECYARQLHPDPA